MLFKYTNNIPFGYKEQDLACKNDILEIEENRVLNTRTGESTYLPKDCLDYFKTLCTFISDSTIVDKVNHPSHYTWLKDLCGIEVIDITRHLDFDKGNVIKYVLRSGYKDEEGMSKLEKEIQDLKKARFYINDKIEQLEKEWKRIKN